MVVFCGMDCSGKSTVIDNLYKNGVFSDREELMYHPPKEWYEKTDILTDYYGKKTKMVDEEEVIFTKKIRLKIQEDLIRGLYSGKNYVFHRYIYSLYTYYAGSKTVPLDWIRNEMSELIQPDEVIYLRIDIDEFRKRSMNKPMISFQQVPGFVDNMIAYYDELAKEYHWKIVDTSHCSVEATVEICKEIINKIDVNSPMRLFNGVEIVKQMKEIVKSI